MTAKPRLSFWQIWNMSFGFLGIQFGFALQNANASRILKALGPAQKATPAKSTPAKQPAAKQPAAKPGT